MVPLWSAKMTGLIHGREQVEQLTGLERKYLQMKCTGFAWNVYKIILNQQTIHYFQPQTTNIWPLGVSALEISGIYHRTHLAAKNSLFKYIHKKIYNIMKYQLLYIRMLDIISNWFIFYLIELLTICVE